MREINKFRAWDGKKFTYWTMNDLCTWDNKDEKPSALDEWQNYTGLKDKNGKEIYEGDIVKFIVDQGEMKTTEYGKSTISFWDFQWKVGTPEEEYGDNLNEFLEDDLEIIGNIYENPELLSK